MGMKSEKKTQNQSNSASGDYYFNDQGLMVFTKQYHLKRGFCCGNGCKHCPYPKG